MEWISVTAKKKPTQFKWYLVWREDGLNTGESFLVWDDGQWIDPVRPGTCLVRNNVTHWLVVSAPLKEKDGMD